MVCMRTTLRRKDMTASTTRWRMTRNIHRKQSRMISIGMCQLFLLIMDFTGILLIGILFDIVVQIGFFSLLFMSLQRYAGSYHANTRIGCYIGSMGISVANACCFKYLIIDSKLQILLMMCSLILINILSPVYNNILDTYITIQKSQRTVIIYNSIGSAY